ncbi:MAG: 6-phosphofructokinase, partial [Lactobacillus delbrueckii]
MTLRVGILTSGGDCQALNATMRGLSKTLYNCVDDVEIIGFKRGYYGLMHEDYVKMKPRDFSGIINEGGTILGTSRQPFKEMRVIVDGFDKVAAMKKTYKKL